MCFFCSLPLIQPFLLCHIKQFGHFQKLIYTNTRSIIHSELFENCPKLKNIIVLKAKSELLMLATYYPLYDAITVYIIDCEKTKRNAITHNLNYVIISSILEKIVSKINDQNLLIII